MAPSRTSNFLIEVLAWWFLCFGFWLITLSVVSSQEILVALPAALPCALLAVAGRKASKGSWKIPVRPLVKAFTLPFIIIMDTAKVLLSALPGSRSTGWFSDVKVEGAVGTDVAAEGWQALMVALTTLTPTSIVFDMSPHDGIAHVHWFGGGRPLIGHIDS